MWHEAQPMSVNVLAPSLAACRQSSGRSGLIVGGGRVAFDAIDGLAAHPIGNGRLTDGQAVSNDGEDRVITLFHFAELHEHSAHLLARAAAQGSGGRVSRISRYCVTDHLCPQPVNATASANA